MVLKRDRFGRFVPSRRDVRRVSSEPLRDSHGRFAVVVKRLLPREKSEVKKAESRKAAARRPEVRRQEVKPTEKKFPVGKPTVKKPAIRKLAGEKPKVGKPAAKKPLEKPTTKKPVAKKPVAKKPVVKKLVAKKPVAKKPTTTKKPVAKKPVVKKLAAKKPVAKKPVAKKPVAKKPVAKKPVAKKPVAKKPVAKKPVAKKPVAKKPAAKKPVAKKPPKKLPKKKGLRPKRKKKAELPPVPVRSREAETVIQAKLATLLGLIDMTEGGLDMAIQSFINGDGSVDGELRISGLPERWRTPRGLPDLIATLSSAFQTFPVFDKSPPFGGGFWVTFAVRFGPQNETEAGELADLYKRFRGLFQIGTYPTPAWNSGPIQIAITDDNMGLRSMIHSLEAKRGIPPSAILIRFLWGPEWAHNSKMRPGHYKDEK